MCHLSHLAKTCGSSIFRKKKTWIKIDSPEFLERNQHGNFGYQPHGTYIPYDDSEGTWGSTASLEVPKKKHGRIYQRPRGNISVFSSTHKLHSKIGVAMRKVHLFQHNCTEIHEFPTWTPSGETDMELDTKHLTLKISVPFTKTSLHFEFASCSIFVFVAITLR